MTYSRLTTNLTGAQKRYETFNGRKHLILPTVGLVEGVHPGSKGPLFYRKSELSRNLDSWNYRPAMVNHPTLNGASVSACDPAVIERQSVGHLFNTAYDGRLKYETWADEEKLEVLAPDIHRKVLANEVVEVSTGLHHDIEETPGEWNGEKYVGIVLNMMGDHLAILTNEKGACDVTKGAGLLVNADGVELSYDDVRQMLCAAIKETMTAGSDYCYVCDVFPKYAVYEANGGMYKVGYSIRKGKVTLTDGPSEVRRQTSYVLTDNGLILITNSVNGNNLVLPSSGGGATIPPNTTETDPMAQQPNKTTANSNTPNPAEARKSAIDEMIAGGFVAEAERPVLEGLSEGVFVATHKGFQATKAPAPPAPAPTPAPQVPVQGAAALAPSPAGATVVSSTAEQWLEANGAPPEVKQMVSNAIATDRARKQLLVNTIFGKPGNVFSKEWLALQDTSMLEGMAKLGAAPTQNAAPLSGYAGQASVPMFINGATAPVTVNAGDATPLEDPVIDFAS